MAGLRMDAFDTATADRHGYAALVPGKREEGLIYQRTSAAACGPVTFNKLPKPARRQKWREPSRRRRPSARACPRMSSDYALPTL
jgi:hypothetical protein